MPKRHLPLRTLAAILITSTLSLAAQATNRALILGIQDYREGRPLLGVSKDMDSAEKIALAMGVERQNMVRWFNQGLDIHGMRKALVDFQQQVQPGDRVFVYFSGHGTSRPAANPNACEVGLVSQEMGVLTEQEFHDLLGPIRSKASKLVVVLDACYSGGVAQSAKSDSRGEATTDQRQAKFWAPAGRGAGAPEVAGVRNCYQASNVLSHRSFDIIQEAKSLPNHYFLAAASADEQAIDGGPEVGGYATTALLRCMQKPAGLDTDKDGTVSFDELKACAQRQINQWVQPPFLRQTLTAGAGSGGGFIPMLLNQGGSMVGVPASVGAAVAPSRIDGLAFIRSLKEGADATAYVQMRSLKPAYRVRQDFLELEITSSKSGYLTLVSVGSDGKIFQLFPNALDKETRIDANRPVRIPRDPWRVLSQGPAGSNQFLALVSGSETQFSKLGIPLARSPFSSVEATTTVAKDIIERTLLPEANCQRQEMRSFDTVEVNPCANRYGAALIEVMEIN